MFLLRPWLLLLTISCFLNMFQTYSEDDRKAYIVYMGDHPKDMEPTSLPSLHMSMAQQVLGSDFASGAIIHSYKKSFNGFVVKLTEAEAKTMAEMDDVVSVFPNKKHKLHTTRSWDFIGFPKRVRRASSESDIVVGVLDSGVWPESESFNDKGFGPPPTKWKGSCYNFSCNNKLIGAKYHSIGVSSGKDNSITARDKEGHGTHCASTAAGNFVSSASLYSLAYGTARGGAPSARIAMYKVCSSETRCSDANILAGFDEAIADGVDIISISLGSKEVNPQQFFDDSIAIGAFHAMRKGIVTSHSAGNEGPKLYTMSTFAPWLISVAATTTDRKFFTKVQLGNGKTYEGVSINTFEQKNETYPLILAADAPNTAKGYNSSISRLCLEDSVDEKLVKGKIVLCEASQGSLVVGLLSGATGVLIPGFKVDTSDNYALPAAFISIEHFILINTYIKSTGVFKLLGEVTMPLLNSTIANYYIIFTSNASASIFKSQAFKDSSAPYVASFSSRGPNSITPDILKPDIAAPGNDILAAWTLAASITDIKGDKRKANYNIMSGTSMACPHVTGVAAYVKSFHPNWSPAAIKSALMTTATPLSSALNPEAEFAYGAGQINPAKAVNPGLVYDISEDDYVKFLCGQSYDTKKLRIVTKDHKTCTNASKKIVAKDLNLPSFAVSTEDLSGIFEVFHRTVTNVGSANSTYKAKVIAPPLLNVEVNPRVLKFTSIGQKKSFTLSIEGVTNWNLASASLVWDDGSHKVKSPIIVYHKSIKNA